MELSPICTGCTFTGYIVNWAVYPPHAAWNCTVYVNDTAFLTDSFLSGNFPPIILSFSSYYCIRLSPRHNNNVIIPIIIIQPLTFCPVYTEFYSHLNYLFSVAMTIISQEKQIAEYHDGRCFTTHRKKYAGGYKL